MSYSLSKGDNWEEEIEIHQEQAYEIPQGRVIHSP